MEEPKTQKEVVLSDEAEETDNTLSSHRVNEDNEEFGKKGEKESKYIRQSHKATNSLFVEIS